jgi:hypothetical protein
LAKPFASCSESFSNCRNLGIIFDYSLSSISQCNGAGTAAYAIGTGTVHGYESFYYNLFFSVPVLVWVLLAT